MSLCSQGWDIIALYLHVNSRHYSMSNLTNSSVLFVMKVRFKDNLILNHLSPWLSEVQDQSVTWVL